MMFLLRKIAISNGNKKRKDKANETIAEQTQEVIVTWNKKLEAEIQQKKALPCYKKDKQAEQKGKQINFESIKSAVSLHTSYA